MNTTALAQRTDVWAASGSEHWTPTWEGAHVEGPVSTRVSNRVFPVRPYDASSPVTHWNAKIPTRPQMECGFHLMHLNTTTLLHLCFTKENGMKYNGRNPFNKANFLTIIAISNEIPKQIWCSCYSKILSRICSVNAISSIPQKL